MGVTPAGAATAEARWHHRVLELEAAVERSEHERDTLQREFNAYKGDTAAVVVPLQVELQRQVELAQSMQVDAEAAFAKRDEALERAAAAEESANVQEKNLSVRAECSQEELEALKLKQATLDQEMVSLTAKAVAEKKLRLATLAEANIAYTKWKSAFNAEQERLQADLASVTARLAAKTAEVSQSTLRAATSERETKAIRVTLEERVQSAVDEAVAAVSEEKDALLKRVELLESQMNEKEAAAKARAESQQALHAKTLETQSDTHKKEVAAMQAQLDAKVKSHEALVATVSELTLQLTSLKKGAAAAAAAPAAKPAAAAAAAPRGQQTPSSHVQVIDFTKQQAPAHPAASGTECTYLTNEAGWRAGTIVSHANGTYSIKDKEKGWTLNRWPEEHVKPKTPKVQPAAAAPAPAPAQKHFFPVGAKVEGLYDGKWFDCTVSKVDPSTSSYDVTWTMDNSYTPGIEAQCLRAKVGAAPQPKAAPQPQPQARPKQKIPQHYQVPQQHHHHHHHHQHHQQHAAGRGRVCLIHNAHSHSQHVSGVLARAFDLHDTAQAILS
eukprot:TRINITY_DN26033_c2_g1_i3.p1 TRINITY_DN26033_c2_g1~~TRINITY_DN26033_c2_g1_i3.p1  ORF type:complete len:564 (+),score=187.43 TRINITY_DN26033_c2_g1_i3:25-1692(+)